VTDRTPLPDFDTLRRLHVDDPEGFEQFRKQILREAVESAPSAYRPALESLLSDIDAARQAAATPMEAAHIAFRMMQSSVERLAQGWVQAQATVAGWQAAVTIERVRRYKAPAPGSGLLRR
jgi:hypothetical protein